VLQLEVLVGELGTVDALTTCTLLPVSQLSLWCIAAKTHVAAGEVTTLEHEVGNHAVEL